MQDEYLTRSAVEAQQRGKFSLPIRPGFETQIRFAFQHCVDQDRFGIYKKKRSGTETKWEYWERVRKQRKVTFDATVVLEGAIDTCMLFPCHSMTDTKIACFYRVVDAFQ
jgi:hypothetical protein